MAKIIAAVPFHVEQGGQLTKGSAPGFCQLIQDLSQLGNLTKETHGGQETKDAIPSETARIELFHNLMFRNNINISRYPDEREELWRRCITLFALSQYRRLNIETEAIQSTDCSDLVWEIFGQNILDSTGLKDTVLLMKCQGQVIAVSDIHTIWTPVAGLDVLENMGFGRSETLEPYEKNLLLTYLDGIAGKGMACDLCIRRFMQALKADGASINPLQRMKRVMAACSSQWQDNKPQSVIDAMFSIPVPEISVPYPFFHSLCLTRYTTRENMYSLYFQVEDDEGSTFHLTALLPLSKELISKMEQSEDISIGSISINGADFKKKQMLAITLALQVKKEEIIYRRVYTKEEIRYSVNMPTISVFPYVNLPYEVWRDYNLVLLRESKATATDFIGRMGLKDLDAGRIDLAGYYTTTQSKANSSGFQWYYAKLDKLPHFITLCETETNDDEKRNVNKEDGYIGSLALILPEDSGRSQKVFSEKYSWAIDLGTSNTIAAWKGSSTKIYYDLIKRDIHMPLLDSRSTVRLPRFLGIYAPTQERSGRYRTMGIVYERHPTGVQNHCYEHGCALFYDFKGMSDSLSENANLADAQIITDIKFGSNTQIDQVALHIYLENMLWLGCLNAILQGAGQLNVMISYPREEVRLRIGRVWDGVQKAMSDKCSLKINLQYVTEAEANYWYQKKNTFSSTGPVAVTNDFGIIDIGHGTSDMNLFFHAENQDDSPKQLQISVRYAGKEILVDTINSFFQNDAAQFESIWDVQPKAVQASTGNVPQNAPIPQDNRFDKDELGRNLIKKYKTAAEDFAALSKGSQAVNPGENKPSLEAKQSEIVITLLQEIGLQDSISAELAPDRIKKLVMLLKFKYMNLFLLYSHVLRSCPQQTSNSSFKLFIYGGGRQGIRAITGSLLSQMGQTGLGQAIRTEIAEATGISIGQVDIITKDTDQKNEVVDGMLYKENNSEETREVYSKRSEVASFLGDSNPKPASKTWNVTLEKELKQTYDSFVRFYKEKKNLLSNDFSFHDREPKDLYWYITIADDSCQTEEQEELVENNSIAFANRAPGIWDKISNDKENPSKILYLLFCCKMSEDILLEHLR